VSKQTTIGKGLGGSASRLLEFGEASDGLVNNVITGDLEIPSIEVSCSIIQVVKRGSARDRRKIKPYKRQAEYFEHLSVEDEEILMVISEFLFLEAA
jgi:hypothetical protein